MEVPDNANLIKIAESVAATQFVSVAPGKIKPIIRNVKHITSKRHPSFKDITVLEFSAESENVSDGNVFVSALMKKTENSWNNELQLYSTLFKDLQQSFGCVKQGNSIYGYVPHSTQTCRDSHGHLYSIVPRPLLITKPYLFLENLESASGTNPFKRLEFGEVNPLDLDFGHCLLAVETLAKFHATSYIYRQNLGLKGKGKMEMLQKYPFLNQASSTCIFSPSQSSRLSSLFEDAFDLTLALIESENPSLAFKLRRKVLNSAGIIDKCVKLLEEEKYDNDDFYVVCCGNFVATENLLYSYEEDGKGSASKQIPKECSITNLDFSFMGPLASDLAVFLLTCTSLEFRQEFEEKLLAFYCDAFQAQVQNMSGINQSIANEFEENIDEFHRKLEKQYRKMLEFGFYNACVLLPLILFKNSSSQLNNNNENDDQSCSNLTLRELIQRGNTSLKGNKEFENFCHNNSFLKGRLIDILKQLGKCRVLL